MAEMINAANDAVDDQNLTLRQSLIDTITYVHSLLKYGMNQDALLRLHEMQREAKQMVDPNARVITEVLSKMVEAHVYPHRMQEEPWTFEEARKLALICRHDAKGIQDQLTGADFIDESAEVTLQEPGQTDHAFGLDSKTGGMTLDEDTPDDVLSRIMQDCSLDEQ